MNWDIYEQRLFPNRDKVKKLIELKKKGTLFAERIDVPYDKLVEYKDSIRLDLEHAEEDYEVFTNHREFTYRTKLEAQDPMRYKDLPKSKFVDLSGESVTTKAIQTIASEDISMEEYFAQNKISINQQLFITNYINHGNATKAVEESGYVTNNSREFGYKLLNKPHIQKAIALFLAKPLDKFEITPESIIKDLVLLKERAMEAYPVKDSRGNHLGTWKCDTREALKAVEMLGNYLGMFNKHVHKHVGHDGGPIKHEHRFRYNFDALSDEELRYFEERIKPKIKIIEKKD